MEGLLVADTTMMHSHVIQPKRIIRKVGGVDYVTYLHCSEGRAVVAVGKDGGES